MKPTRIVSMKFKIPKRLAYRLGRVKRWEDRSAARIAREALTTTLAAVPMTGEGE